MSLILAGSISLYSTFKERNSCPRIRVQRIFCIHFDVFFIFFYLCYSLLYSFSAIEKSLFRKYNTAFSLSNCTMDILYGKQVLHIGILDFKWLYSTFEG
jgi:hypothetical protein